MSTRQDFRLFAVDERACLVRVCYRRAMANIV